MNVLALTALTRALLPRMIAQKRGAILNVSSSAGFLPLPGIAVYAATKAYVTSFSEAIRAETRDCGITVTALCPGPVHTEFARGRESTGASRKAAGQSHACAGRESRTRWFEAIERDKPLVIPGIAMKIANGDCARFAVIAVCHTRRESLKTMVTLVVLENE